MSILSTEPFDGNKWEERLASALDALSAVQKPFLEAYWLTNGFPDQVTFNGIDETPFPSDDLYGLYESVHDAERFGKLEYYKPLQSSLSPVRSILRSHPGLTRAVRAALGYESLQVGIINGSSWTNLNHLIVGQMARQKARSEQNFDGSAAELNALLQLSIGYRSSPLPGDLDLGLDIAFFHGAHITDSFILGDGYSLMPYSQLSEFIDSKWLKDIAPDQFRYRNWQSVCAIVHEFRWKPDIRSPNSDVIQRTRMPPPLFHRWVSEFANLLAVTLGKPLTWMTTMEGCVSRSACDLLGSTHSPGTIRRGRAVGHLHNPFKVEDAASFQLIEDARLHFANKSVSAYAELAPIIQRLAEALCRNGRYATEDKVLDIAVALERLFKPSSKSISGDLQNRISELLGSDDDAKVRLKRKVKHFYDVRSAIIHGPTDEKKKRLQKEVGTAFQEGFEIAQESLLRKLG